jgi:two-component system KDP operon response regulator KdpE
LVAPTGYRILVVDDDEHSREAVSVGLALQLPDSQILLARDGDEGLALFLEREPDLVLLDVAMPGKTGFDVLREIRRVSNRPVIMLSALSEEAEQVRGLELGADDYIAKPFSQLVLLARIKAVLRRAEKPVARGLPDYVAGGLTVHFEEGRVSLDGRPVDLTRVEYKLLYHLVRNAGCPVTRQALVDRVWGSEYGANPEHLKVYIGRLRAKIQPEGGPRFIENVPGQGYRFVRPEVPRGYTGALG